ncbi:DUF6798 domain-containing protein [Halobaculum sp. P14]|uniref:DUF6798 domain-containing protein n=1 Tax=Halobaculum sp. P14 TaxID=3421638 RepID=UPI003EB99B33
MSEAGGDDERSDERFLSGAYSPRRLLTLAAATLVAYLVTTPPVYIYGLGDQANQLPLIKHTMDPSYLANDWVVGVRTGFTAPKFYYNQFVAAVAEVIGLPEAVLLLYVLSVVAILVGVFVFVRELVGDELAAVLTVGLLLAHSVAIPGSIPYPPDLGGNSLIQSYLRTSTLANAFVVAGMAVAVKKRYRWAFASLGVATLFHVTNGFWIALTVGLCTVAVEARDELQAGDVKGAAAKIPWGAALLYGVISSAVVIPLLIANLSAEAGFEAAYVMAWIRHPHHYVLSTWPVLLTALTIAFMVGTAAAMYYFRELIFPGPDESAFALTYVASIGAILFFGGYVFTEVVPVGTVIKLTPYRTEDFLYVVLYAGIAKLLVVGLHRAADRTDYDASTFATTSAIVVVLVATVAWSTPVLMIQTGTASFDSNLGFSEDTSVSEIATEIYVMTPSYDDGLGRAYRWIESETPRGVVFLAPPSQDGFRLATSRARVVNVKSFPFRTDAMLEWERRMNAVCDGNIRELAAGESSLAQQCDQGFNTMSESEIRAVADEYGATWLLTKNSTYDFQQEFSSGEYYVYRISANETAT